MAEVRIPIHPSYQTPLTVVKSWLWRQVKVILTLLPGHESGAGVSWIRPPQLAIIAN
jgi:hypothetical protein